MIKYFVRLDDACPNMDYAKWNNILGILDRYSIKPLIGIIPNNEDVATMPSKEDPNFWDEARKWQEKKYSIALHGYNHCYCSNSGGINPLFSRSEFAGLSYEDQCQKMANGYRIIKSHGLNPRYFFAPSHTFDYNTLKALIKVTPIRTICDTMAFRPYRKGEITIIPQQIGSFKKIQLPGYWVFCFHPNVMNKFQIRAFEEFIKHNRTRFHDFSTIPTDVNRKMGLTDKLLNKTYLLMRRIMSAKYSKL